MAAVAALYAPADARADPPRDRLGPAVGALDRYSVWTLATATPLDFDAFHPQGLVRVGDAFYLTSVEVIERTRRYAAPRDGFDRDQGRGQGWLFKLNARGELLARLKLGEGAMYHAGGLDFDGRWLWVPAAEYRPGGPSILYRVDPKTLAAEEAIRVEDHIGAIAWDAGRSTIVGVTWGGQAFHAWRVDREGRVGRSVGRAQPNTAHYVGYQDCHGAGAGRMLCSGVAAYRPSSQHPPLALGGLDLIDLTTWRPTWQAPVLAWTPRGASMTSNAAFLEVASDGGLRGWFVPEDGRSALYAYDIRPGTR